MSAAIRGLNICPYCGGTDIAKGRLFDWSVSQFLLPGEHDICHGLHCENCGKSWVVTFQPTAYHLYDGPADTLGEGHQIKEED